MGDEVRTFPTLSRGLALMKPLLVALACLVAGPMTLPAQPVPAAQARPAMLHPLIPIPMPRKAPRYATFYSNWLPLQKYHYLDLELLEGRLEHGAFAKVRFGKMLFEGTVEHFREMTPGYPVQTHGVIPSKGRLTLPNGDVYTGELTRFSRSPYVFLNGEYKVKAEPTTITFYPVDFDMDGRTYRFDNGDTLVVDKRVQEGNLAFEVGTYRYANGATLGLNHRNGDAYDGIFDYRSPDGFAIRGRVYPHSLTPGDMWDIKDPKLGAYRLLLLVYGTGDRVDLFGVLPERTAEGGLRWSLQETGKPPLPVKRLADHVYAVSGNGQDEETEFLVIGDPWIYRAKAPFAAGKPVGQVRSVAFHKSKTSARFVVTGFMEGFAYDGPCERSRENAKESPITLLAEKGVFKKGFLKWGTGSLIELNKPDEQAIYTLFNVGEVKRTDPSGLIYIGTTDRYYQPFGEGSVYFPDGSYLTSDRWKNGEVQGTGKFYATRDAKTFTWTDFSFSWAELKPRKAVIVTEQGPSILATANPPTRTKATCTRCEGTGSVFISCTTCYGKGTKRDITSYNRLTGRVEGTGIVTCSTCQGGGRIRIMGCVPCNGTGTVVK
jgi:hypothetical protein